MSLLLLGLFLVLVSFATAVIAVNIFRSAKKQLEIKESELRLRFMRANEAFGGQKKRIGSLSNLASTYVNSLKKETGKELFKLQQLVNAPASLMEDIEAILSVRDFDRLEEAEILLDTLASIDLPQHGAAFEDNRRAKIAEVLTTYKTIPANWPEQIQNLVQKVGMEVYNASSAVEHLKSPELRKERDMRANLRALGVAGLDDEN